MNNTANLLRLLVASCALAFSLATLYYGPTATELRLWAYLPFGRPELLCQTWSVLVAVASSILLSLAASDWWLSRDPRGKGN